MKTIFILFIGFFIVLNSFASLRETMCNGEWNNMRVWKNGIIPQANDTILIKHYISRDSTLITSNNVIIIEQLGELCGQFPFTITQGSKMYNYGSVCASLLNLQDTLINYGTLKTNTLVINGYLHNFGYMFIGFFSCFDKSSCTPIVFIQGDTLISNTEAYEYAWYFNNQLIEQDSISIIPQQSGYYKLKIRKEFSDDFGDFSDSVNVVITSDEQIKKLQIEVIQRNIDKIVEFEIKENSSFQYKIEIYNGQGQQIENSYFDSKFVLNMNKYANGVYMYSISNNQRIKRGKFILQ